MQQPQNQGPKPEEPKPSGEPKPEEPKPSDEPAQTSEDLKSKVCLYLEACIIEVKLFRRQDRQQMQKAIANVIDQDTDVKLDSNIATKDL